MRHPLPTLTLLVAVGCASSAQAPRAAVGTGTVAGTVGGAIVAVADAISGAGLVAGLPTRQVLLWSVRGICGELGALTLPSDLQALQIDLFVFGANGGPATLPGDYAIISDDPTASGSFAVVDYTSTANPVAASYALGLSGTVTVTAISDASVTGTFDVTLQGADHVTGTFDAPACGALQCPVLVDGGRVGFPCQ